VRASLPDVNVLVALMWPSHLHHQRARQWFDALGDLPWATCPLTQSGLIRASSNPRVVGEAVSPGEAVTHLRQLQELGNHEFWSDDLDFAGDNPIPLEHLMGHRQVTDAYLLGLAIHHEAQLVTFDRGIQNLLSAKSSDHHSILLLE
jgi:toxin-antitoxin system PIN domain toxin